MTGQAPGYVFSPTNANADRARRGEVTPTTGQGPIQTLSYSLPKFKGAGGLSPLQGDKPSGASPFASAVLQSVLRTVLGSEAEAFFGGSMDGGSPESSSPQAADAGFSSVLQALTASPGGGAPKAPVIKPGIDYSAPIYDPYVPPTPIDSAPGPGPAPMFGGGGFTDRTEYQTAY
jgi:hypothetical protein